MAGGSKRLVLEIIGFVVVVALILVFVARNRGEPEAIEGHRIMMGTIVSVTVYSEHEDAARAAIGSAFNEIARVEALTSKHSLASAVATLNAATSGGKPVSSPEIAGIVGRSLGVSEATGGAFDVTIEPVMALWSFDANASLPDHGDVLAALDRVDYARVLVDTAAGTIELPHDCQIDLDGIAKGYAVDRAIATLRTAGVKVALVDAGGDLSFLGLPPARRSWRIGVKHPRREGMLGVLALEGGSVATSGDYQRCTMIDGVRYHHILDPSTGYPARGVMSVTVTARRAVDADALATAVFVMGPEAGMEFVESMPGVEAIVVTGDEEIEEILVSRGLEGRFAEAR